MIKIIVPEPRKAQTETFEPFGFAKLENVSDAKSEKSGKVFFRGYTGETLRILMAEELAAVNKGIIEKYEPVVVAEGAKDVRKALADKAGHLAPLVTEEGFIALPGEEGIWNDPEISRHEKLGLIVE
jgi:hypothetical protein